MRDGETRHEISSIRLIFVDRAAISDFLYLEPCLVWINPLIHCRRTVLVVGKVAKLEECR